MAQVHGSLTPTRLSATPVHVGDPDSTPAPWLQPAKLVVEESAGGGFPLLILKKLKRN